MFQVDGREAHTVASDTGKGFNKQNVNPAFTSITFYKCFFASNTLMKYVSSLCCRES